MTLFIKYVNKSIIPIQEKDLTELETSSFHDEKLT